MTCIILGVLVLMKKKTNFLKLVSFYFGFLGK